MSEYQELRNDLETIMASVKGYGKAMERYAGIVNSEIDKLWTDNAELRDDLHAVANRLEALTAFVTSNPAEVAAKIVNDANRATLREVRDDA